MRKEYVWTLGALGSMIIILAFATFLKKKKENYSVADIDWSQEFDGVKNSPSSDKKAAGDTVRDGFGSGNPQYTWREQVKPGLWICPDSTLDMGTNDDKQCLVSSLGPRMINGRCPYGSTNNSKGQWDQQCIKGYTTRKFFNGKWQCYSTARDTGRDWGQNTNNDINAQQCLLKTDVISTTTRMWDGKKWVCPPCTTDTGLDWWDGWGKGHKQCKINPYC